MSHIPKESVRCEFSFPSGRRCRQIRAKPGARYCSTHGTRQQQQEEAARIGDEIVGTDGALNTQEGIHKALVNVFCNLARKRISARDASVLGYVGQLMLVHCPSLERMMQSSLPMLQFAMKTRQQMDRSTAHADKHERHLAELQFDLLDRIMLLARSDQIKNMPDEDRRQISEAIAAAFKKEGAPAGAKP
jgi:hypothetical protein